MFTGSDAMFKRAESVAARGVLIALLAFVPTAGTLGQAVPPTKPAAAKPEFPPAAGGAATKPVGVDAAKQKRNLDALLLQGIDAMAAEDYKAARDAFFDALSIDPRNGRTLEALGTTYIKLNDVPRARGFLERAAVSGAPVTRSLAVNTASILLRSKNAMRAAKFVRDYIAANPAAPPDEDCLNALATALAQADDTSRLNKFFAETIAFYESYNAKLEATRPGQKRWGAQWMSAKAAEVKLQKYKAEQEKLNALGRQMTQARARFTKVEADYSALKARAKVRSVYVNHGLYQSQMRDANDEYLRAKSKHDDLLAVHERPPFLPDIGAVAMSMDAMPAAPVAVAVATPPAPGTTPGTTPPAPVRPPTVTPPVPGPIAGAGATVDFGELTKRPTPPPVSVASGEPSPGAPEAPRRRGVTKQAAAFPVAADLLVTSAEAVAGATRITLQAGDGVPFDAAVVASDEATGLALLKAAGQRLMPLGLAASFAGGNVSCVGFPSVNIFDPVPETLAGGAPAIAPGGKWTVRLARNPRLGGSPLLAGGKVVGVQLATRDADAASVPAATLDDLKKLLADHVPAAAVAGAANPLSVTMQLTAVR